MSIEFEFQSEDLTRILQDLPRKAQEAVVKTVRETTQRALKIMKFKTPIDSGEAFRGWETRFEKGGLHGVLVNNLPYINVLEFGGYPVRPIRGLRSIVGTGTFLRGKAILGGADPGPRTQRAPGGTPKMRSNVSKQAPRGMVRSTLEDIQPQFIFDLSENLDRALA